MSEILKQILSTLKELAANPYLGLVGVLLSILSLWYAYYTYKKGQKKKILSCSITSNNLIENEKSVFPKLRILYDGVDQNNFTVTNIRLVNIGTEVISPEDIARNDPLRITSMREDVIKLLDYSLIYASDPNNNIRVSRLSETSLGIDFDYIEPKDRATIQILHNGVIPDEIKVTGTIIGATKPFSPQNIGEKTESVKLPSPRIGAFIGGFIPALFVLLFAYLFLSVNVYLSVICALPGLFLFYFSIRALFRHRDPDKEAFATEFLRSAIDRALERYEKKQP